MEQLAPDVARGDLSRLTDLLQATSLAERDSCLYAICDLAAKEGRCEVLQWVKHQHPLFSWSCSACSAAAEHGHLEALQWLRSQSPPCPWSEYTCTVAARSGQLEILQWLRSQVPPCPWSEFTCWDPPCPWKEDVGMTARAKRHDDVLGWALLHGCPIQQPFLKMLRTRLLFLTCIAHQQNSCMLDAPACTLGHHLLRLPPHVLQHIVTFL